MRAPSLNRAPLADLLLGDSMPGGHGAPPPRRIDRRYECIYHGRSIVPTPELSRFAQAAQSALLVRRNARLTRLSRV